MNSHRIRGVSGSTVWLLLAACGGQSLDLGGKNPTPGPTGTTPTSETRDWNGNWQWLAPQLTGQALRAAWVAAPDDIWMVGDSGTVLRWDGKSQAKVVYQGPADVSYNAIVASSVNNVWIAGSQGALHFNGTSWSTSTTLGNLSVRTLVSCSAGSYVAVTTDGQVFGFSDERPATWQVRSTTTGTNAAAPILDVVCTKDDRVYMLDAHGVDMNYVGVGALDAPARVATFTLPGGQKIGLASLIGQDPGSFQYVFEQSDAQSFPKVMYYAGNPGDGISTGVRPQEAGGFQRVVALVHTDAANVVAIGSTGPFGYASYATIGRGETRRVVADSAARGLGAYQDPNGDAIVVGDGGYAAKLKTAGASALTLTPLFRDDMPSADRFRVTQDGTPWILSPFLIAYPQDYATFALRDDSGIWQHHPLADAKAFVVAAPSPGMTPAAVSPRYVAFTPLSKTSVWFTYRYDDEAGPGYVDTSVLVHWNGTTFDLRSSWPQAIEEVAADGDSGLFVLASTGEFSKVDKYGTFSHLADVGTAAASSAAQCTPTIATLSGSRAWILDRKCQLNFWDGVKLQAQPSMRAAIHGARDMDFGMWSSGPTSLWVTDPMRGLLHFDGQVWSVAWTSDTIGKSIWGADDTHVWFIDSGPLRGAAGRVMRMWDGGAVKPIMVVSQATTFAGNDDGAWLAGGRSLLRLNAVKSVQPTH